MTRIGLTHIFAFFNGKKRLSPNNIFQNEIMAIKKP
jgi:hypothetical protein